MATKSQRLLIPSAGLASDTADPSSVHSAFQRLPNANPVGEMIRIQVHTLHKVASNPQSDGTAGKEAAQRRENLTSKFFFFLSKFSCLWGDQKKEKEQAQALQQVRLLRETKEAFVRAERRASPQRIQAVHTLARPCHHKP